MLVGALVGTYLAHNLFKASGKVTLLFGLALVALTLGGAAMPIGEKSREQFMVGEHACGLGATWQHRRIAAVVLINRGEGTRALGRAANHRRGDGLKGSCEYCVERAAQRHMPRSGLT